MSRRRRRINGLLALARHAERSSRWESAAWYFRRAGDLMKGGDELDQARASEMHCLANLKPAGGTVRRAA